MGVIPFELQQFGFEFGTIYETINDILYIFFWGVTSMKRCHLPFFLPKRRSTLSNNRRNGRGVFCGEKFPSG